jgi:hypothetical protein
MNEETKKEYSIVVAKKSEKLVTALYLVTDLVDESEPIKHSLRRNAVTLLSSMNSLSQLDVKDRVIQLKHSPRVRLNQIVLKIPKSVNGTKHANG